jgi:lipoic acid synthetase
MNPNTTLETLISDFQGIERNLDRIVEANPRWYLITWKRCVDLLVKYVFKPNDRSLEVLRYLKAKE